MFIVEAMYASYYVTAVIVLLRMLVAMMTTSYRDIEVGPGHDEANKLNIKTCQKLSEILIFA